MLTDFPVQDLENHAICHAPGKARVNLTKSLQAEFAVRANPAEPLLVARKSRFHTPEEEDSVIAGQGPKAHFRVHDRRQSAGALPNNLLAEIFDGGGCRVLVYANCSAALIVVPTSFQDIGAKLEDILNDNPQAIAVERVCPDGIDGKHLFPQPPDIPEDFQQALTQCQDAPTDATCSEFGQDALDLLVLCNRDIRRSVASSHGARREEDEAKREGEPKLAPEALRAQRSPACLATQGFQHEAAPKAENSAAAHNEADKAEESELEEAAAADATETKDKWTEAALTEVRGTEARSAKAERAEAELIGALGTEAKSTQAEHTEAGLTEANGIEATATEPEATEARFAEARRPDAKLIDATSTDARSTEAMKIEAELTEAPPTELESTKAGSTEAKSTVSEMTAAAKTEAKESARTEAPKPAQTETPKANAKNE